MNESDAFLRRTGRHFIAGCLQTTTSIVGSDVGHLPPAHIYVRWAATYRSVGFTEIVVPVGVATGRFTPSGTSVPDEELVVFN